MQRIEYIRIGNKIYPMCFSLGARKMIEEIYGSINKFVEKCEDPNTVVDAYLDGLEIMTKFGAARINELGEETITQGGAIDANGAWHGISKEKLEILLCPGDTMQVGAKILSAINKAAQKEIKVAPTPETLKNADPAIEVPG